MRLSEVAIGLFFVLLGVVLLVWIIPTQIKVGFSAGLAPDFFPRVVAWSILVLGALYTILQVVQSDRVAETAEAADFSRMGIMLLTVATLIVTSIAMHLIGEASPRPYVGFWCTIPLATFVMMRIHGGASVLAQILTPTLGPLAIFAASWFVFRIPMP